MRTIRRFALLTALLVAAVATQGLGAAPASAATTCRTYGEWQHSDGSTLRNQRVCVAPASDFPRYTGWGRFVDTYSTVADRCRFSLLPIDVTVDGPQNGMCPVGMAAPQPRGWRWTGSRWVAAGYLYPGQQVYIAPYASGWRWVWTSQDGWLAVSESNLAFRWLA